MNDVSPVNTTIKYGALNGLAAFAFFIILWLMGHNPLGTWSVPGWAIPVVFTMFAMRDHRNKELGGYITYGRALGTGMLVSVFAGFLFSVLIYSFMTFWGQNIIQMQIDDSYASIERLKGAISEDLYGTIMRNIDASKNNFTPGNLAVSSFEARIFGGLIISLIFAAVYKKNQPPSDISDTSESNPS